jgi:DegV family protein with EDD domain
MEIGIITDSSASFTELEKAELGIKVVNLHAEINGKEVYKDISLEEYYDLLEKNYAKTSAPSIGEVEDAIQEYVDNGVKEIFMVTMTKKASATYESFRHASENHPNIKFNLIDSDGGLVHNNAMVRTIRELIQSNTPTEQIVSLINNLKKKVHLFIGIDSLEYMKRSGRISHAKKLIGTILKVKPIIQISDGIIHSYDSVRSEKKLMDKMKQLIEEKITNKTKFAYVLGVKANEKMAELEQKIKSLRPNIKVFKMPAIDPAVGSHTGPRSFGFGLSE